MVMQKMRGLEEKHDKLGSAHQVLGLQRMGDRV